MFTSKIKLLALLVSTSLSGSALAAIPGTPSISDSYKLAKLSMVTHSASETSYSKRIQANPNGLKVDVSWNIYSNDNAKTASVLLNGSPVWTGTGNTKTAPLIIKQGGTYKLEVKVCNDDGCATSQSVTMNVIDTDGSGFEPLTPPLQDHNKPYENRSGKVVGTYYTEWSQYGRQFPVKKIPAQNLTHILYGFIPICGPNESLNIEGMQGSYNTLQQSCQGQEDYTVTLHDMGGALGYNDQIGGNFGELIALKKGNPNLKILPSIGGWTLSDPFFDLHDATKRATFIKSVKTFLETWKFFDGVDIDWEFPGGGGANPSLGNPEKDKPTYTLLMKELRQMLNELSQKTGRKYELTSAIGAGEAKIANVDYTTAQQYMDYIFVMNYDFAGHFDLKNLNHQTSLYTANDIGTTSVHSTEKAINALLNQHVKPQKLVVGVAEYGRAWAGVHNYQPNKPFTGIATGPMKSGNMLAEGVPLYKEIVNHFKSGNYKEFYDDKAQAAYIFNDQTGELISYDNPRSVEAKGHFVSAKNLGGLFSWEIGNSNGDLLNAMHEGLGNGDTTIPPVNQPPVVVIGLEQTVASHETVTLDGSKSYDPEGKELHYTWKQVSGEPVSLSDTSGATTTFEAPFTDSHLNLVFELEASDGVHSASQRVTVNVKGGTVPPENQPPVAHAGHAQTVTANSSVTLDGSGSHDPEGDTLTYTWKQTAGKTVALSNASGVQAQFTAPEVQQDETLKFTLTVSDGNSSDSSDVTITVKADSTGENQPPIADAGKPQTVVSESSVVLNGSGSRDPDGDKLTYIWTQKSGTPVTLTNESNVQAMFTAPSVEQDQTLTFTLTVSDGQLKTSSDVVVTVKAPSEPGDNEWKAGGTKYTKGQVVTWKGKKYRCIQGYIAHDYTHTPDIVHAHWVLAD